MERSLNARGQFGELKEVMSEYFNSNHVELVPEFDLDKPPHQVFYLPMHTVHKETSTTTQFLTHLLKLPLECHSMTHCWLDPVVTAHYYY